MNASLPPQGWVSHEDRTDEQRETHDALVGAMPTFALRGDAPFTGDRALLWDFSKRVNDGKHFQALHQLVGSCVGHGKANAEWYLQAVQVVTLADSVTILPYEPYGYAQSRVCAGISGGSDGSTGSGAADAAKKYGVLDSTLSGLPPFEVGSDTITFSGSTDQSWGRNGAPDQWIQQGVKHLVKTTAPVRNSGDVKRALQAGYPCTIASNWGGQMRPSVVEGVLLNRHADSWSHQMSIIGWHAHPSLGDIFYIMNSWGADAHGTDPFGGPPGGFWVKAADVDYITSQDDSFAYSQFDGFPDNRPYSFLLV